MKVNLKVLQGYNACNNGIEYFKKLEKQEWDIVELMEKCNKDGEYKYIDWLWQCIDNQEDFKRVIYYYCKNKRPCSDAFQVQAKLFKQDVKLFYKAVRHQLNHGGYWQYVFKNCGELFKNNTTLFKTVIRQHIERRWTLEYILKYCGDILETMPKLYNEAKVYQVELEKTYKKTIGEILFCI
jgi:hypothetical protein